jgi:glycosyltransferase involved in cell wall biosynthesis
MSYKKLLSIITINKNNGKFFEKTLSSILKQTLDICDLIVIDGGSTDKSVNVIRKYSSKIFYWSSSKDINISDAFNKGLSQVRSEWIMFINSDDFLLNKYVFSKIYKDLLIFKKFDMIVYKVNLKSRDLQKTIGCFGGSDTNIKKLKFYNVIPHQATIINKNFFAKNGMYSLDFPIAQDYEILLRKKNLKIKKINKIVSVMRDGGVTNSNRLKALHYFMKAQIKNNVNPLLMCYSIYIFGIIKILIKFFLKNKSIFSKTL